MSDERLDDRLSRIARATAEIRAGDRFADAVLARVLADEAPLLGAPLWRLGRVALAAFLATAIACLVWSERSEASLDDRVLASFETVEMGP